jgi:hypothetical protein
VFTIRLLSVTVVAEAEAFNAEAEEKVVLCGHG